jgi:hypothetical protein
MRRPAMNKIKYAFLFFIALLVFSACNSNTVPLEPLSTDTLESKDVTDTCDMAGADGNYSISVHGTKDGVEEFLILLGDFDSKNKGTLTSGYAHDYDTCYNITPEEIKLQKPGCRIFKFSESSLSVLQYEGDFYMLGESFGGLGVVDMKLADLNDDGEEELYFTYSWGSGLHRSHIAYFDFKEKTGRVIDYVYINNDMMIIEDEKGGLSLYHANISCDGKTDTYFIEYSLESGEFLGKLVYKDGSIIVE